MDEDQARAAAEAVLKEKGYLRVGEVTFSPDASYHILNACTPGGLEVRVYYVMRETPSCAITDPSSDPSVTVVSAGIPNVHQGERIVRQHAESLPACVDDIRAEGWTVESLVFGGEWSMEIDSYTEIEGYKITYVLHPEDDEWVHFVMGLGLAHGVDWYTPPNTIVSCQTAFNALTKARESGAPTQSRLDGLREEARRALSEAGDEIRRADWSVGVEDSTLTLVAVSGVPMGREMLNLELRVENWADKDLLCEITGYFPDVSVPNRGGLPEPQEFVGGEKGITVRQSENGIPTPQQAAQLLLRHEEYDV